MRARNLKPAIFTNELLAVSDPLNTVIFAGLWCLADREGRLEDRPARIHMAVNPGRGFQSTSQALDWLAMNGFITRYDCGPVQCIQVMNFLKHQHPHQKEPPSILPPPRCGPVPAPDKPETGTGPSGHPWGSNPADSLLLNPDSGYLKADTPKPRASPGFHADEVPRETPTEYREAWLTIQAKYPTAPTRSNWLLAERAALALVSAGKATWARLEAQVAAYAAFCRATARLVAPAELFFAEDGKDRWAGDWTVPQRERPQRGGLTDGAKTWGDDPLPDVASAGG